MKTNIVIILWPIIQMLMFIYLFNIVQMCYLLFVDIKCTAIDYKLQSLKLFRKNHFTSFKVVTYNKRLGKGFSQMTLNSIFDSACISSIDS